MLDASFLTTPLAHRALHALGDGRPENSRAAIRAAIRLGYGIEIDLQMSADGRAMVFHDYALNRLTGESGAVRQRSATNLGAIRLTGCDEGIPTFAEVLGIVAGQVPLLVEIKDQDGALGPDVGALEKAAATDAANYAGPLAFMSFNPHSMIAMARYAPETPRGLVTDPFSEADWPLVPAATRDRLRDLPDLAPSGAQFISHNVGDLASAGVHKAKAAGLPVLCWTVRSAEQERIARRVADNITFEGYLAAQTA